MCIAYVMKYLVPLLHAPILICENGGAIQRMFGGQTRTDSRLVGDIAFRQLLLQCDSTQMPALLRVEESVFAVLSYKENAEKVLIGPCDSSQDSIQSRFVSGILLLWHMLTGMECTASEVMANSLDVTVQLEEQLNDTIFERQEQQTAHNPYEKEQREQECIRVGDVNGLHICLNETYEGEYGRLAANPVRQSKDLAIGIITLASRSAISGGVNPELSFSMADGYIYEIEEHMHDPIAVEHAAATAQLAFAKQVHQRQTTAGSNPIVRKAKDYIFKNMHSKISVRAMAETLHVHPDYLSALFRQVEGRTITAYILEEKLNLCKNLLKYSAYSIQEISAYFAFTSQSYFTQQFKKYTGVTPLAYRHMLERKSG